MITICVDGIGVMGPGLSGWESSRAIFVNPQTYHVAEPHPPEPTILPPNELRRSSTVVRWALQVAAEAVEHGQAKENEVATVFSSSGGECDIWHKLCSSLAEPHPWVSPTLFHHSVHNAVAGYWSIGTRSTEPSVSLACYDYSFGAGLLEAACQVAVASSPVLLVVYDLPPPAPIWFARPLCAGFCVALLLRAQATSLTRARLSLALHKSVGEEETTLSHSELEQLRTGNPAARALPLLTMIAQKRQEQIRLSYLMGMNLEIRVAV